MSHPQANLLSTTAGAEDTPAPSTPPSTPLLERRRRDLNDIARSNNAALAAQPALPPNPQTPSRPRTPTDPRPIPTPVARRVLRVPNNDESPLPKRKVSYPKRHGRGARIASSTGESSADDKDDTYFDDSINPFDDASLEHTLRDINWGTASSTPSSSGRSLSDVDGVLDHPPMGAARAGLFARASTSSDGGEGGLSEPESDSNHESSQDTIQPGGDWEYDWEAQDHAFTMRKDGDEGDEEDGNTEDLLGQMQRLDMEGKGL